MAHVADTQRELSNKTKIEALRLLFMASNVDLTAKIWYPSNLISGVYTLGILYKDINVYVLFQSRGGDDPDSFQVMEFSRNPSTPFNRLVGQHYDMFGAINQAAHFLGLFVRPPM